VEAPNSVIGPLDLPVTKAPAGGTCVINPPCTVVVPTLNLLMVSEVLADNESERGCFLSCSLSSWNFLLIQRVLLFSFRSSAQEYDFTCTASAHC